MKYDFNFEQGRRDEFKSDRKREMLEMREQGFNYEQIAIHFRISRQRVYQIIGSSAVRYYRYITERQCIYIGIRDWLNRNKLTITAFVRIVYKKYHSVYYGKLRNYLLGKNELRKTMIDRILEVTGLTYEEAFKEVIQ